MCLYVLTWSVFCVVQLDSKKLAAKTTRDIDWTVPTLSIFTSSFTPELICTATTTNNSNFMQFHYTLCQSKNLPQLHTDAEQTIERVEPGITRVEPGITRVEPGITRVEPGITRANLPCIRTAAQKIQLSNDDRLNFARAFHRSVCDIMRGDGVYRGVPSSVWWLTQPSSPPLQPLCSLVYHSAWLGFEGCQPRPSASWVTWDVVFRRRQREDVTARQVVLWNWNISQAPIVAWQVFRFQSKPATSLCNETARLVSSYKNNKSWSGRLSLIK